MLSSKKEIRKEITHQRNIRRNSPKVVGVLQLVTIKTLIASPNLRIL